MKRVSFEVAKAIKDAGYPQEGGMYYNKDGDLILPWSFNNEDIFVVAPYYLDVWLWLWREKKIVIEVLHTYKRGWFTELMKDSNNDPEEAIEAAIEYLVTNKLIK